MNTSFPNGRVRLPPNQIAARLRRSVALPLVAGVLILAGGCASRGGILAVDCCADIPAGAVPEPAGSKVCDWQTAEVSSAIADQTVLYHADFIGSSAELSPGAIERMVRNVNSGLITTQSSLIEPTGDASLDAARVNTVHVQLASYGVASPLVEIATPAALGLRGPLAERVAGGFGNNRNSTTGTGAPVSRASGQGSFGGNLPGGIF